MPQGSLAAPDRAELPAAWSGPLALHHLPMRTHHPLLRRRTRRPATVARLRGRIGRGLALAVLPGLVALAPTATGAPITDVAATRAAARRPMAPVSPDLAGLPAISRELADVPVSGRAVDVALARYEAVDGNLTLAQSTAS